MEPTLQATNPGSRVRLLSSRQSDPTSAENDQLTAQREVQPSQPSNHAFPAQVLATWTAIAMMLSARLLLLLASMGAFMLAYLAMQNPDGYRLAATVIYNLGVVAPITWLYYSKG